MKKFPFTKKMRVTKKRDFEALYEEGFRFRGTHLTMIGRRNGLDTARLGLSVSKKKMARAVDRNQFKRFVREAFRLNREKMPASCDLVVIPNHGIEGYTFALVLEELLSLGEKAKKRLVGAGLRASPENP